MPQNNSDSNHIVVELSEPQDAVMNCRKSLILNMAGQGAGKTNTIAFSSGQLISKFPKAFGFIGANTHKQLSDSTMVGVFKTWEKVFGWSEYHPVSQPDGEFIVGKVPPLHFTKLAKFKEYHNIISFRQGTIVFMGSLENYKAHDGKEFAWSHLDETKDTKEAALTDVILGRLRQIGIWYDDRKKLYYETDVEKAIAKDWTAWNPCYIHTSPAMGTADWISEIFKLNPFEDEIKEAVYKKQFGFFYREFENKAVCIYSSYHNAKHLPPNFLDNQLTNLKPAKQDKLIFGLPFGKSGGEYYPSFERRITVKKVVYTAGLPVHLTFDFNVKPYMTLVCAQVQYVNLWRDNEGNKFDMWEPRLMPIEVLRVRIYREYCLRSPRHTVVACCESFVIDHDEDNPEVYYYGDGSGLNRIAGMGAHTNFKTVELQLAKYLSNWSKRVRFPNIAPLKRRDLLDKIFDGGFPEIEIEIDESCIETIKDFEKLKEGPNGKLKKVVRNKQTNEDEEELGHTSDAVEYMVSELFREYIKRV